MDGDQYRDDSDALRDDDFVGVRERVASRLEPTGYNIEGIGVRPSLTISTKLNSNILAIPDGPEDLSVLLHPELELELAHSRMELMLGAWLTANRYQDHQLENNDEYGVSASGKAALSKSVALFWQTDAGRYTEPRIAISARRGSLRPVQYDQSRGAVGVQKTRGRLLLGAQLTFERLEYLFDQSPTPEQESRITNSRSRDQVRLFANGEYSFTPDTAIWGLVRANSKSGIRNINRDSSGIEMAGGLRFKPTRLIEIAVALGYLEQAFTFPLRDVKGLTVEAQIKWLPTMLTTVAAGYSRKIENRSSQSVRDFFVNESSLKIDHELRRNLILDFSLTAMEFDMNSGISNRRYGLAFGATYRPNRHWTTAANFSHLRQYSRLPALQFRQSQFLLSFSVAA